MFQEDIVLVKQMIQEEITTALAALKPAKVVKVETPKPVEVEVKAEGKVEAEPVTKKGK